MTPPGRRPQPTGRRPPRHRQIQRPSAKRLSTIGAVPASLSAREAIWLALEAQNLHRPRPRARPGLSDLARLARQLGTIQLDAVNVLARTQLVVPFSRLGSYDTGLLLADAGPGGSVFEYWGHATSLLPVELQPALRWRMAERRDA